MSHSPYSEACLSSRPLGTVPHNDDDGIEMLTLPDSEFLCWRCGRSQGRQSSNISGAYYRIVETSAGVNGLVHMVTLKTKDGCYK